ncbi:Muscarinic acetylcholine receptor DM1-like 2, partial [Homarus americanus]
TIPDFHHHHNVLHHRSLVFPQVILIAVVAGFLSIATLLGNLMVMISFKIDKQLQTISNYFLFSLAVADITIGVVSMPLFTLYTLMGYWPLGSFVCDTWLALDYLASNASRDSHYWSLLSVTHTTGPSLSVTHTTGPSLSVTLTHYWSRPQRDSHYWSPPQRDSHYWSLPQRDSHYWSLLSRDSHTTGPALSVTHTIGPSFSVTPTTGPSLSVTPTTGPSLSRDPHYRSLPHVPTLLSVTHTPSARLSLPQRDLKLPQRDSHSFSVTLTTGPSLSVTHTPQRDSHSFSVTLTTGPSSAVTLTTGPSLSVTRPLTYRVKRTPRRAAFMIGSAWIAPLILWPPWIYSWPYIEGYRSVPTSECYIQFIETNEYVTFGTAIAAFYLPVTVMCGLYWRIWRRRRTTEGPHQPAGGKKGPDYIAVCCLTCVDSGVLPHLCRLRCVASPVDSGVLPHLCELGCCLTCVDADVLPHLCRLRCDASPV